MAEVVISGFDDVETMFRDLSEIPDEVKREALADMAAVAENAVRRSGEAMGVRDPESAVHILDKITHTKIKVDESGGFTRVTFSGKRQRGNSATRNAEIAFINEYGKRGQPARPFIRQAAESAADQIANAGEKVLGDWFETTAGGQ